MKLNTFFCKTARIFLTYYCTKTNVHFKKSVFFINKTIFVQYSGVEHIVLINLSKAVIVNFLSYQETVMLITAYLAHVKKKKTFEHK